MHSGQGGRQDLKHTFVWTLGTDTAYENLA